MPRAIISVSDKSNIVDFAQSLSDLGWDLIASGGTASALRSAGLAVTPVEVVTGAPEMLGGRVKTLHPAVHAGILARDIASDIADLETQGYAPISMVVCNLYPFQSTVAQSGVTLEDAIEQIDIGGVTLLRAAAKNFSRVTVISDPEDYNVITEILQRTGEIPYAKRQALAVKAFAHTRDYDTAICGYLQHQSPNLAEEIAQPGMPDTLAIGMVKVTDLAYGENPHQEAAFYAPTPSGTLLNGSQLAGPLCTYTMARDLDLGWSAVCEYAEPTVVMVKQRIPIGISTATTVARAFAPALASDRSAAAKSIIAVNRPVDDDFVTELGDLLVKAIAAPDFTETAIEALQRTRKNCCLLKITDTTSRPRLELTTVTGGMLGQLTDPHEPDAMSWRTVTRWKASPEETASLRFAWQSAKYVPSSSFVIAAESATVGIGGGQLDQLDSAMVALQKAGSKAQGAVLASDTAFSSTSIVELAVKAGITAIVQTGGSMRDAELIEAADDAGIAMVFTGVRHARH